MNIQWLGASPLGLMITCFCFDATKLMQSRSQIITLTLKHFTSISYPFRSSRNNSTKQGKHSSERSLLKMHLTRNIRLGSDKSGHKVALFPFVNYLQGQSPDPHVSSDTTLLQTSCLVFQKQQQQHQQKEKIMAVPSGIQNTTQKQILTLSPASNFP